ncbi:MAG: AraC family transcriptional regulator [Clostridia bacterium]|nr:AraC family transcriptional regulator [Clostridia bacterium]
MFYIDLKKDRSERVRYDYPDLPLSIHVYQLSAYPNYACDSHWHGDIEMIAILSGQMLYNVNGKIMTLNRGEGILVNAKQLHYGFSESKTECEFICIMFHPMLLCTMKLLEREFVEPILRSGISHWHLTPEIPWQGEILNHMRQMSDRKNEKTAPLAVQSNLFLLWNEIVMHTTLAEKSDKTAEPKLTVLKNMITYVHGHYAGKITLADIAAAGHISKRTCGALFLEYQNKTPIEFLTDYRLRKSIELMKNTELSILDISLAVGFSGASYYAETFRKFFGQSPAEYRKSV